MTTIFITRAETGWHITFKGGDFRLCVDTLKSFLPPHTRSYNPTKREWFVDEDGEGRMHNWLRYAHTNFGVRVEWASTDEPGDEYERPRTPPTSAKADPFATLHLLPSAPPSLVRAAYRELAKLHHPDHGGDVCAMRRINDAYRLLAA